MSVFYIKTEAEESKVAFKCCEDKETLWQSRCESDPYFASELKLFTWIFPSAGTSEQMPVDPGPAVTMQLLTTS